MSRNITQQLIKTNLHTK